MKAEETLRAALSDQIYNWAIENIKHKLDEQKILGLSYDDVMELYKDVDAAGIIKNGFSWSHAKYPEMEDFKIRKFEFWQGVYESLRKCEDVKEDRPLALKGLRLVEEPTSRAMDGSKLTIGDLKKLGYSNAAIRTLVNVNELLKAHRSATGETINLTIDRK